MRLSGQQTAHIQLEMRLPGYWVVDGASTTGDEAVWTADGASTTGDEGS